VALEARAAGRQAIELGGHGGMDYILNLRLVQCFQQARAREAAPLLCDGRRAGLIVMSCQGLPPDVTAYEAAAWSAPGPLSEISVAPDALSLLFFMLTSHH
jgi:hypothetical protein